MKSETVDSKRMMTRFVEACREAGVRVTPQRIEIFRELMGLDTHPDTETVHRRVRRKMPGISLDTVYRTLGLLEEKKLISRVGSLPGPARYEANPAPHHHFVCTTCGSVADVAPEAMGRLHVADKMLPGCAVKSIHVEIRGICSRCVGK